jgi:hypothetical protein
MFGASNLCTVTGQCVECLGDTDCRDRQESTRCSDFGQCVQCLTSADCDGGYCDQSGHCPHFPTSSGFNNDP